MKDLVGPLTCFLGLEVHKTNNRLFINQYRDRQDLIALARLQDTPVDTHLQFNVKYRRDDGNILTNATIYRKLVWSLVFLTFNLLDLKFLILF